MPSTIITKNGSGAPLAADLVAGELAVDLTNGRLYTEDSGGSVIEIGLNPSGNVDVTGTVTLDDTLNISGGSTTAFVQASGTLFQVGSSTASDLVAYTNNAERLRIDSSGNVGIGTDSPSSYFSPELVVHSSSNLGGITIRSNATTDTNYLLFADGISGNERYRGYVGYDHNTDTMNLATGASPAISIDSSGNVGIGTDSPADLLHVKDTSSVVGGHQIIAEGGTGGYGAGISFQSPLTGGSLAEMARITADGEASWNTTATTQDAGLRFYTSLDGTVAERLRILANGNTTFKANNSGQGPILTLENTDTSITTNDVLGQIDFYANDGSTGGTGQKATIQAVAENSSGTSVGLIFGTSPFPDTTATERLRIDSSGNVGIGTDSQDSRLVVQSPDNTLATDIFKITSQNAAAGLKFGFQRIEQIGPTNPITFNTGGSEAMQIDSSGNLLVGTTSLTAIDGTPTTTGIGLRSTGSQLHSVNDGGNAFEFRINGTAGTVGSISCSGSSTAYNQSSDYRLKENVVAMSGATERLKQLKPSRFNFIANPDKTVDGFLAHEVQDIVPEAITGTKDAVDAEGNPEYQGIDQSKLVPLLVATIQELEARIAALEGGN